jgi:ectoine hydroxylase-related dioxygenase (phytanoyl-CoA dioxygenase family)
VSITEPGSVDVLTRDQLLRYARDGFLDVTEPLISRDEVRVARERVDRLFDRWSSLPRRLKGGNADSPPLIARIYRVTAIDQGIAHSQLMRTCREIASAIMGVRKVWCRFDSAIYKYPGAGPVSWHQDIALSMTRMRPHSVHFWIPLNDHALDSGCMAYVPGSHQSGMAEHRLVEGSEGFKKVADPPDDADVISVPLSVGNLSLHSPMTMHRSDPNRGTDIRKALTLEFSSGPWSAARQIGRPLVSALLVHPSDTKER